MKLRSCACWWLILLVPLWAWPQAPQTAQERKLSQPSHSETVKKEIQKRGKGEKARVRVSLHDKTELKGYISSIEADSFQLTDQRTGRATTIAYQDVVRVRGAGLSVGAKIAIVAGVVVGIAVIAGLAALQASGE
jgi:hypothetical protein